MSLDHHGYDNSNIMKDTNLENTSDALFRDEAFLYCFLYHLWNAQDCR